MDGEIETPKRRKEDKLPRKQRKGMYILPSLFTIGNVAAGYYAILQIMHASVADPAHLDNAAKAIGFAVLFDGLDGRIARMTRTSSDFGRELDSLADAAWKNMGCPGVVDGARLRGGRGARWDAARAPRSSSSDRQRGIVFCCGAGLRDPAAQQGMAQHPHSIHCRLCNMSTR